VLSKKGERKQNSQEKFNTFGESEIAADTVLPARIAKPYDSAKSRIPPPPAGPATPLHSRQGTA
jgi:hypothetical protein